MKIIVNIKALVLGLILIVCGQVNAFPQIYFFGDSLSDTGNAKVFSGNQDNPYFPSRFSDGKVAVDFLAEYYGLYALPSLHLLGSEFGNNYSVGGAKAVDADGDEATPDTHLPTQINSFLTFRGGIASSEDLHAVIIGGNDLFQARDLYSQFVLESDPELRKSYRKEAREYVDLAVASTLDQLAKLIDAGAQNLLVANAPNIGYVPATQSLVDALKESATNSSEERRADRLLLASIKLSNQFNSKLKRGLNRLIRKNDINLIQWDLSGFLDQQIEGGESLGYGSVDQPCQFLQSCDGYVFYDAVHPTSLIHQRAVQSILDSL